MKKNFVLLVALLAVAGAVIAVILFKGKEKRIKDFKQVFGDKPVYSMELTIKIPFEATEDEIEDN